MAIFAIILVLHYRYANAKLRQYQRRCYYSPHIPIPGIEEIASGINVEQQFPKFKGRVIKRGDADYEAQCYQYASSSYLEEDIIRLAAIIKAADDSDVIKAIKYASDNKIAVAVRTGELHVGDVRCQLLGGQVQCQAQGKKSICVPSKLEDTVSWPEVSGSSRIMSKNSALLPPTNEDLFFAVLGGSPGNFGVLTHATLHVFRDQDNPNSHGFRAAYPYDRLRLKALLDVMVEMAEVENFPADYDYCISVLTSYMQRGSATGSLARDDRRFRAVDQSARRSANLQPELHRQNSTGRRRRESPSQRQRHTNVYVDRPLDCSNHTGVRTSVHTRPIPVPRGSRISGGRIGFPVESKKDAIQFPHFGGSNSRFCQNGKNSPTSFSWRDTRLGCTMDAFYHSYQHEQATKWQQENDEGVGKPEATFCEHDRRVLWGSHDFDLSDAQQYYYDQHPEGKYERLCKIPEGNVPADFKDGMQPRIKLAGSEIAKEEVAVMELEEEPQLSTEAKFWKMASMESVVGKPVPLWDIWRA
ncbi:13263_t:CDS:2 [Ambispora gerdemannii]|uniref:13263_t:CDS:1 n=1 Tax=Ambispora gerdemannii TaxID=144530 RepID=A0A9N9BCL2_9GLOM|nr:13263_t:CDS:2 [Ambispora gerdemannii]